jgi:PAS domain S-box-containing protein
MKNIYDIIKNSIENIVYINAEHKVLAINQNFNKFQKIFNLHELKVGDYYDHNFSNSQNTEIYSKSFILALNGTPNTINLFIDNNPLIKWIEFKMLPVIMNDRIEGVTLYLRDVSKEKRIELEEVEMSKILRAIIDIEDTSILLINTSYKILFFNKLFEKKLFENCNIIAQIDDNFKEYITEDNKVFLENLKKALNGENNTIDIPFHKSEDETNWSQIQFKSLFTDTNELIGVLIIAKDITKEKNFELLLNDSEQKLKIMVENNPIAKFIIQNNKIIYANPVFAQIYKLSESKFLNNISFEELIHPEDIKLFQKAIKKNSKSPNTSKSVLIRTYNIKGKLIYVEFFVTSTMYNNEPAIVGSVVNITERIKVENKINLAILETQEKERMQIGMELHDNVKQILSGISIYLNIALKKIDEKEEVILLLNKLKKYNDSAVNELRRLSHQLAPLVETESSLKDKIDWLIQNLKLYESLVVSLSIEIDETNFQINDNIQLHFYRILQELITNTLKYSKANKLEIKIYKSKAFIWFNVKDNGVGFDINHKKQGIGLENIRRRVKILNGELKLITDIGKGVEVIIKVPYT